MEKHIEESKVEEKKKPLINEAKLIRIMGKDLSGDKKIFFGLTKLKGVSWSIANATCTKLRINPYKKIEELTEQEIKKITEFLKNPELPAFMLNRRKDYNLGDDRHLIGADFDLQKEFDIKRLKKIKAYKGIRHMLGQPVRGQRTKSHFRSNRKSKGAVGVAKSKGTKTIAKPAKQK